MEDEYAKHINWAKSNKRLINKTFTKLKNTKNVDKKINSFHSEVFENVDCLKCGNCCKTTGPLLTSKDITRISSRLKMGEMEFITTYLRTDEDGDYVFQSMPCPFLGDDNYCFIYEDRPRACREFPHTDQKGQLKIAQLTRKNVRICPGVALIIKRLQEEL